MNKKNKNNLTAINFYSTKNKSLNKCFVIYSPYLKFILKYFIPQDTYLNTSLITVLDKKYSSRIYLDIDKIQPEYQFIKTFEQLIYLYKKEIKQYLMHIKDITNSQNKSMNKIKIYSELQKFYGIVTVEEYKSFIIYLMHTYKLNKKVAYNLYKTGKLKKQCILTIDLFDSNFKEAYAKLYKSEKVIEKAMTALFDAMVYPFIKKILKLA